MTQSRECYAPLVWGKMEVVPVRQTPGWITHVATQNPQRFEFGAMLHRARLQTGLKPAEIERELRWYPGKVSRVEAGSRVPVPAEVDRLADLYKLTKRDRETLTLLADAARKREAAAHVADFGQTYLTLERAAADIRYYDSELIFGLMQTEGYARSVLAHTPTEDAEGRIQDRLARRATLTRDNPPDVRMVLGEAALHRRVGGEDVLREQLQHLLRITKLPNVAIRILPFTIGAHVGLGVGFTFLRLTTPPITRIYIEGLTDATYIHEPDETSVYEHGFDEIWTIALDERNSATMLRKRIGTS
jgi:transcriptional regulator with XRE-family HTH domain